VLHCGTKTASRRSSAATAETAVPADMNRSEIF
jgi:hypothetical protein